MLAKYVDQIIAETPALQQQGEELAQALHKLVLRGGEPVRKGVDVLHGTWLGHPLHPLLTDIVVGAWSLGALFDLLSLLRTRSRSMEQAADTLTTVGIIAALPTALSGAADFSTIPKRAAGTGVLHALFTDASLGMYIASLWARKKGARGQGLFWAALGLGLLTTGAYVGGHLVFGKRVGVNRAEPATEPQKWTPILPEAELPDHLPKRLEISGKPVLLYRDGQKIYGVGAICPHAGAPLEEGRFKEGEVTCPWHDSVFELCDGQVIHGPATNPLPRYEVRINQGQIEIRAAEDS